MTKRKARSGSSGATSKGKEEPEPVKDSEKKHKQEQRCQGVSKISVEMKTIGTCSFSYMVFHRDFDKSNLGGAVDMK